ncbi:hypothetical protein PR002_g12980 [Phytophthora rubi]|uniref:Integrase catalytic domain-containing protein n=1 Tax=Phytophthora rubi TaxID=129364 RepID=A0A6A3LSS5_9STRA|nr:hypothetical protein PR002_g12980 [Phytophthora rubi]
MNTGERGGGSAARPTEAQLWHVRLGHIGASRMPSVARAVDGVPVVNAAADEHVVCAGCAMGKLSTSAFPHRSGSTVETTGVFDLVHSDVMGPMQCSSKGGARFIVTFIDDFSRFVHVLLLSAKYQVFQSFVTYNNLVENQTGARGKCLRSDNGKEFVNKRVRAFCGEQGILQQTSAPYSPHQNGLAKRMNRTIVESARSTLYYMELELEWWGEAVNAAVYTINRVPNTARPHVSHLRFSSASDRISRTFEYSAHVDSFM